MYSINDAYIPKSVDYRTLQLQRNHRQSGSRKKLISKYDYLKPYIDYEFSDVHSSRIAQHFERYIKETKNYKKETSFFIDGVRNKILFLHNYNLKVAEITFKYPLTRSFTQLLLRYVILECNALYKRDLYRPTYEALVEQRVLRLLLNIYNTYLESLMTIPPEELMKEAAKAVLKLIIRIKTEFDIHCNLMENIAKKLLTKMGELERITTLIDKFPIDTYLSDPGFINTFSDIITSDYGTDEELRSRPDVDDEDQVNTINERCDSCSDNSDDIKQEMDDISSINRLYRPQIKVRGRVPTIYLDDDDMQMFLWEEEVKTSDKSSRRKKEETSVQTKTCRREMQYKSFIGHRPLKLETLENIKYDNDLEVIDLESEDESSSLNNSSFNDTVYKKSTQKPIVASDVIIIDSDEDDDRIFSGSKENITLNNLKQEDQSLIRNLTCNAKTLSNCELHHEATTHNIETLGKYVGEIYYEELTEKVLTAHDSDATQGSKDVELSKEVDDTSLGEDKQEQEIYNLTSSCSGENTESANISDKFKQIQIRSFTAAIENKCKSNYYENENNSNNFEESSISKDKGVNKTIITEKAEFHVVSLEKSLEETYNNNAKDVSKKLLMVYDSVAAGKEISKQLITENVNTNSGNETFDKTHAGLDESNYSGEEEINDSVFINENSSKDVEISVTYEDISEGTMTSVSTIESDSENNKIAFGEDNSSPNASVAAGQEISKQLITENVNTNSGNETFDKTHAGLDESNCSGEEEINDSVFINENSSKDVETSVTYEDISEGTMTSVSTIESDSENNKIAFGEDNSNEPISDQHNNSEVEISNLENNLDAVISETETRDKYVECNFKQLTSDKIEVNKNLGLGVKTILNERDQDTGEISSDIVNSQESEELNGDLEQTGKSIEDTNIFVSEVETNIRDPTTDDNQINVSKDLKSGTQNVLENEDRTRIENTTSCDEAQHKKHVELEKDFNQPVDVVLSEEGSYVETLVVEVRSDEDINVIDKAMEIESQCESPLSNDQVYLENVAIEVKNRFDPMLNNDKVSLENVAKEVNPDIIHKRLTEAIEVNNQCEPLLSNDIVSSKNVADEAHQEMISKRFNEAIEVENQCEPTLNNNEVYMENVDNEEVNQEIICERLNEATEVENQYELPLNNDHVSLKNVAEEADHDIIPKKLNEAIEIENQCQPMLSNSEVHVDNEEVNQEIIPKRLKEATEGENQYELPLNNDHVSLKNVAEEADHDIIPKKLNEAIEIENQCQPMLRNSEVHVDNEVNQEIIPKRLNEATEGENQYELPLNNDHVSLKNVAEEADHDIIPKKLNEAIEIENQCQPMLSNSEIHVDNEEVNQEIIPKRLNEATEGENQYELPLNNDHVSLKNVAEEADHDIIPKKLNEAIEIENQCQPMLSNSEVHVDNEVNQEIIPKRLNEATEGDNQYELPLNNVHVSLKNVAEEADHDIIPKKLNEAIEIENQCQPMLSNSEIHVDNEEVNQEIIPKRLNEATEGENQYELPLNIDHVPLKNLAEEVDQGIIPKKLNEVIEMEHQCEPTLTNNGVYLENIANEEANHEMIPKILNEVIEVENQCEPTLSNNQVSLEKVANQELISKTLNEAVEVENQYEIMLSNDQVSLENVANKECNQELTPKCLIEDIFDAGTELNKDLNIQKEEIVTEIEILESNQQTCHLEILTSNDTDKNFEEFQVTQGFLKKFGTEILVADNINMISEKIVTKLEHYENPNEPTRLHLLANAAAELSRSDLFNQKNTEKMAGSKKTRTPRKKQTVIKPKFKTNRKLKLKPDTSDGEKCISGGSEVKQLDDNSELKCKPHDFVLHNHSQVPPPANNIYYTQKLLESSLTTEDSNDSEGHLFIDEGNDMKYNKAAKDISEESTKKISEEVCKDNLIIKKLIYYNEAILEENICKSKVKDTVLLSIPDNDQDNFDFLRQLEEIEPSKDLVDKKEIIKQKDDKNKNCNTNNEDSSESHCYTNNNNGVFGEINNTALREDGLDISSNYKRFKTKAEKKDFDKIVLKPYVSIERFDHTPFKNTENEKYKQTRSKSLDLGIIRNSKTNSTDINKSEMESINLRKTSSIVESKSDAKVKFSNKHLEHVATLLMSSNVTNTPLSKLERKREGNIVGDVIDTSDVDDIPLLKRSQIDSKQKISRKSEPKIVSEQKTVKTKKKQKNEKKQSTKRGNVKRKRKSNNTNSIVTRLARKSGDVENPEENVNPSFATKISSKPPTVTNLASKSRSNSRNVTKAINDEETVRSSKVKKQPIENYMKEIKSANSTPVKVEKDSLNQRGNLKHLNKNEKTKKETENSKMRQKSNNTNPVIRRLPRKSGDVENLEENINSCIFDSKVSSETPALTSASKSKSSPRNSTEAVNNEGTVNSLKLKKQSIENYTKDITLEITPPVRAEQNVLNQKDNIKHLDKNYYVTPKLRRKSMSMNRLSRLEQDADAVKLDHIAINVAKSDVFDISTDKKYYTPPKLRRKKKVENKNICAEDTSFSRKKQSKHMSVKVDILTRCKNTVSPTTEKLKQKLETDSKFNQKVISDNDSGKVNNLSTATIEDAALDVIKTETIKTNPSDKESKYNGYKKHFEIKEQAVNSGCIYQNTVIVNSNSNIQGTSLTDKNICDDSNAIYLSHIKRDGIGAEIFKEADAINGRPIKTRTRHIIEANKDGGDKQDGLDIFTKNETKSKDNYENISANTDIELAYSNSSQSPSLVLPVTSKTQDEINSLSKKFIKQDKLNTESSSCNTLASKLQNVTSQEDNLDLVKKREHSQENEPAMLHSENYIKQIESHLHFGETYENDELFKKQVLKHNLNNKTQESDLEQLSSNNRPRKKSITENEDSDDLDNIPLSERTLKCNALENELIQVHPNTQLAVRKKRTARQSLYMELNVCMETKRHKCEIHSESHVNQQNTINNILPETVPITLHEEAAINELEASSIQKSKVLKNKNKASRSQTNISKLTKDIIIKNNVDNIEKLRPTKQSFDSQEDKQMDVDIHSIRKARRKNELVKELGLSSNPQLNESRAMEDVAQPITQMKVNKNKKESKLKVDDNRDKKKVKGLPKECRLSEESNTDDDNSKTILLNSSLHDISKQSDSLASSKHNLSDRGRYNKKNSRKVNSISHISSSIHTSESDLSDCNLDKYINKKQYDASQSRTSIQPGKHSSSREKKKDSEKTYSLPNASRKYSKSKLGIDSPSKATPPSSLEKEKISKKKDPISTNRSLSLPVDRGKSKRHNAKQSKSTKQKERSTGNKINYALERNQDVEYDETNRNLKENVENITKQEMIMAENICNQDSEIVDLSKNGKSLEKEDKVIIEQEVGNIIKHDNLERHEKKIDSAESCIKQYNVEEPILPKLEQSTSSEVEITNDRNIRSEPTQISATILVDGIEQANYISSKSDELKYTEIHTTLENNPIVNINIEKCRNDSIEVSTRPEEVENKIINNINNSQENIPTSYFQEQQNADKQNLTIVSEEANIPSCNNMDSNKYIDHERKEGFLEEDSPRLKNNINVSEVVVQENEDMSNCDNKLKHNVTKELSINLACNEAVISFSQDSTPMGNNIESDQIVSKDKNSDDLEQETFKSEINAVITIHDLQKKEDSTDNNNGQSEHRVAETKESTSNSTSGDILKEISQYISFSDNVIMNKLGSDDECNKSISEKTINLSNGEIPILGDLQEEGSKDFEHKTTKRETMDNDNGQSEHIVVKAKDSCSNSTSSTILKDVLQDVSLSDNIVMNKIGSDDECHSDKIPTLGDLPEEKNEHFEQKSTEEETKNSDNRQNEHIVAEAKESSSTSTNSGLLKDKSQDISMYEKAINKTDSYNECNGSIPEKPLKLNDAEIPTLGDLLEEKMEDCEYRATKREITDNDNGQSEHTVVETKESSSNATSSDVVKDISEDISSGDNVTIDEMDSDDRSLSEKTSNLNIDGIPTLGDLQEEKVEDFGDINKREIMDSDNRQSEYRVAEAKESSSNSASSGVLKDLSQYIPFGDNVPMNKISCDNECNRSISRKTSNLNNDEIPTLGHFQEDKNEDFEHGTINLNTNRILTLLGDLQEKKNENFEHKPNEHNMVEANDSSANSISSDEVKCEPQGSTFDDNIINERNYNEVYNGNLSRKEMFNKHKNFDLILNKHSMEETRESSTNCSTSDVTKNLENFDQVPDKHSMEETRGLSTICHSSDITKNMSQDNRSSSKEMESNKNVIVENLLGSETKMNDRVITTLGDLKENKEVPISAIQQDKHNVIDAEEVARNCGSGDELKNVPQNKISFDDTENNKVTKDGWSENNFEYKGTNLRSNVIFTEDLQTTDSNCGNFQHNEVETKELSINDAHLSDKETCKEFELESKEHKPDEEIYDNSEDQRDLRKEDSPVSSLTKDKNDVLLGNRKRKNVTFDDVTLIEKGSSISKSELLSKKSKLGENNDHVHSLKNKSGKNNIKQQYPRKGEKKSIESIISHLKEEQGSCKVLNEEVAISPQNLSLENDINNVDVSVLRKKLLRKMNIPDQCSTSPLPEVIKDTGSALKKSQISNAVKHSANELSLLQNKINDTSYSNDDNIEYIYLDAPAETSDTFKDVSGLSTTLTKEIISDNNDTFKDVSGLSTALTKEIISDNNLTAPSSVFVNDDSLQIDSTKDVKNFHNVESNEDSVNTTETTFIKNSVDMCSKADKGREASLESFAKELPSKSTEDDGLINFSELMINGTNMDKITVFPEDVCMFSIESLSMVQTSTSNNFMSVDNNIDITCIGEPDDRKFNLGPVGGPLFSGTLEENNFLQTSFNRPLDESKPPVEFPLHDNQPEELEFNENNFRGIMPDDTYISGSQASSDTNAFPLSNYDLADIERMNLMECSISTTSTENRIVSPGIKSSMEETRGTNNDMNPWAQFKANENNNQKVIVLSNEQCITPTLLMSQNDLVQSFTDEIIEPTSTPTSVTTNEIPEHTLLESKKHDKKVVVVSNDQCITPALPVSQNDLIRSFNTGIVSSPKCTVLEDILPKYSRSVPWRKKKSTASVDEKSSLINSLEKINSPGGNPTSKIKECQNHILNAGKQQTYSVHTIEDKSKIAENSFSKESDVQPVVDLEKLGRRAATKKYSSNYIKETAIKSDTLKCTTDNMAFKNISAEAKPSSQFTKPDLQKYPQDTLKPSNSEDNCNSLKMHSKNSGSPKSNIPSNESTQSCQSTSNYSIKYILSSEPTVNINSVNENSAKDCRQSKNRGTKRKLSPTEDEKAIGKEDNKKLTKDYGRPVQSNNSNKDSVFDQLREQGNVNKLISLRVTEDNKLKTERGACSLEQKSCKDREQSEKEKLLKQGHVNKVISPGVMEDSRLKTERGATNSNVEKSCKYREQIESDNLSRPRKSSSSRISRNEETLTSHITSNQRGKVGSVSHHNKGRDGYQSDRRGRDGYQYDRRGRDGYYSDRRGRDGYHSDRRGRDDHNFDSGVTDSSRSDHTKGREGHYGGSSRSRESHSERIRGRGQPRSSNVASAYYNVSMPHPNPSQDMDHSHQRNGPFMKRNTKISNQKLEDLLSSIEPKSRDNLSSSSSHKRSDEEEYSWIEKFNQRINDSDLLAPLNRQIFSKTTSPRKDK